MKFISLFSGVGGFDLGFENAGMECVLQAERDKFATAVLDYHWPDVEKLDDVREVKDGTTDLVCGGFPCQDLSVAGRRAGLDGERSGLWYAFRDVLAAVRPRWVVIENVPGLLSSNKRGDMAILTGQLAELGYWWAYRVLDSQYFGVAQRRRRVFIVGHLAEPTYPIKVLFEQESCERHTPPSRETGEVTAAIPASGAGTSRTGNARTEHEMMIPEIVGQAINSKWAKDYGVRHQPGQNSLLPTTIYAEEVHNTLRAEAGSVRPSDIDRLVAWKIRSGKEGGGKGYLGQEDKTFALDTNNGKQLWKAPTLTASNDPSRSPQSSEVTKQIEAVHGAGMGVRRLTPLECERLQGFPDNWTQYGMMDGEQVEISDTQRYKQMGNAVTVNVAEWIGKRIMGVENA